MPYIIIIAIILFVSFVLAWRAAKRIEGGPGTEISSGVLLSISLPRENEKLPVAAEQMFASLHGLLTFSPEIQEHLSLEIASSVDGIRFYVFTPRKYKNCKGRVHPHMPGHGACHHICRDGTRCPYNRREPERRDKSRCQAGVL